MIAGGGIDLVGQNGVARIDEDLDTVAINDHSEVHMTGGGVDRRLGLRIRSEGRRYALARTSVDIDAAIKDADVGVPSSV